MNKREARRVAHAIASNLILRWRMGDAPESFESISAEDSERIDRALLELEKRHRELGYPNVMNETGSSNEQR